MQVQMQTYWNILLHSFFLSSSFLSYICTKCMSQTLQRQKPWCAIKDYDYAFVQIIHKGIVFTLEKHSENV